MHRSHFSERGQAILLLVLAMVGLLGLTALAIDGGMVYAERRAAQNAADAAALAGALAKLNSAGTIQAAALERAADNGYTNDGNNTVVVHNPPASGFYAGNDEYVQVIITSTLKTSLIHFVYDGPVVNTVEAVARARDTTYQPYFFGNALVGLAPHGRGIVQSVGGSFTHIKGAGIWVNSTKDTGSQKAFEISNNSTISITNGTVSVVGGFNTSNKLLPSDSIITTGVPQVPYPLNADMTLPSPAGHCDFTMSTIPDPGNGGTVDLQDDSIYCITGEIKWNGGRINGHNVVIYLMDGSTKGIQINAGVEVHLDAPDTGDFAGILFYVEPDYSFFDPSNENKDPKCTVEVEGHASNNFSGTIFAPACNVKLTGSGNNNGFRSQVIGYEIDLRGGAMLVIDYNANENHQKVIPPSLDLAQ